MAKNYCSDPEGKEALTELLRILKWYMDQAEQNVTEGLDQPKEAAQALQSLKNLALMKSTLTFPQLRQAGRESMITNAMNAAIALEQFYMANKQQGNAMFVRAMKDEIDNFSKGYPINSSMPDDDGYAPELGDLLQGRLGKLNFQQGVVEEKPGLWANIHAKRDRIKHGSGERMRTPGSKGAPTADALKKSATEGMAEAFADQGSGSTAKDNAEYMKRRNGSKIDFAKKLQKNVNKHNKAIVKTKQAVGSRISDIGAGGKEYNVKTDAAWDAAKKKVSEGSKK
jgi:hypothetical protein